METFKKLSRDEMKNVTGGTYPACTVYCSTWVGDHYDVSQSSVGSCSTEWLAPCEFGGTVLSCTCTVI